MKPASPTTVKHALELAGFVVVDQNEHAWIMESNRMPVVVPQTMTLIPEDAMDAIFDMSGMEEKTFTDLLEGLALPVAKTPEALGIKPDPPEK